MARLVGTGKESTYPKNVVFDMPDDGTDADKAQIEDLVARGVAVRADHPGTDDVRTVEVANEMVRGGLISNPSDQAVAARIDDPHQIVHDNSDGQKIHDLRASAGGTAVASTDDAPEPEAAEAPQADDKADEAEPDDEAKPVHARGRAAKK